MNLIALRVFFIRIKPMHDLFRHLRMMLNFKMIEAIKNRFVRLWHFQLVARVRMLAQGAFYADQIIADDLQRAVPAVLKFNGSRHQIGVDVRGDRRRLAGVIHQANPHLIVLPVIIAHAAVAQIQNPVAADIGAIEAAIRKGLLPLLFGSLGLDNAKQVVEQVIQITRIGLSKA